MTSILNTSSDYTDRDFASIRSRLFALIQSARPSWSNTTVANIGNILVELVAHVGDVLSFMMDVAAAESFLATAQRRESIIALGKLVGYELDTPSAAQATVTITFGSALTSPLIVPAGTVFRTSDRFDVIRFRSLDDLEVPAGETSADVLVENSEGHKLTMEVVGQPNLDVRLGQAPYLDGSAEVTSTGEGAYSEQDSILSSGTTDLHYSIRVDSKDHAILRFGDGTMGAPPTGTLNVSYRTGGGSAGNVEAGAITVIEGVLSDAAGRTVQATATNDVAASGGADRETIEAARIRIPNAFRAAGSRSVTRDDYEVNARAVSGVARALMVTSDEDDAVGENAGLIYIVPDGGGTPSQALLDDVEQMVTVTRPGPPTFEIQTAPASYLEIDISVRATFSGTPAVVASSIRSALDSWFALTESNGGPNENVDFGLGLDLLVTWSDLFNVVRDTTGVRKIEPFHFKLNGAAANVQLLGRDFPVLGDVTIIDDDTGDTV